MPDHGRTPVSKESISKQNKKETIGNARWGCYAFIK